MAHTKNAPAAPSPPSTARSVLGYAIGATLGLALLLVLQRLLTTPPSRVVDELPHLVIQAEFDDIGRPEVREQLCALQRDLLQLELAVQGPLSFPVMVPAREGRGAMLMDLDKLSSDDLREALPYWSVSGYLVPRVFAPDMRSAVLRAAPAARGSLAFLSGTRQRVEALLADARFKDLRLSAYSHALRLDDPEVRARINLTFGVQTAIVQVRSEEKAALSMGLQQQLLQVAEKLRKDPRVRSAFVDGVFVHYAAAAEARNLDLTADQISSQTWQRLQQDARRGNVTQTASDDGEWAQLDVTTDQEAAANRELCYSIAVQAKELKLKGVTFHVRRTRPD